MSKKNKEQKTTDINPMIISELKFLFEHSSARELRKSLTEMYFEMTIKMEDMPVEFGMISHHVYELIKFLEICDEEISNKKTGKE